MLDEIMESALLPILESALRNSSFLELSKEADVYASYLGKFALFFTLYLTISECLYRASESYQQAGEPVAMPDNDRQEVQARANRAYPHLTG